MPTTTGTGSQDTSPRAVFLRELYAAFNARDIERVLACLHPDVHWPNGMTGGVVHGREAVRTYWTAQWAQIDPRVDPVSIRVDGPRDVVRVHQVVRDRQGAVLADREVLHAYTIEGGLVTRMDIEEAGPTAGAV